MHRGDSGGDGINSSQQRAGVGDEKGKERGRR
ncbi:hypothetical protein A2U01_0068380, partial [Trifolium medium]|nr:hypothetical protein [Trifolium medium]